MIELGEQCPADYSDYSRTTVSPSLRLLVAFWGGRRLQAQVWLLPPETCLMQLPQPLGPHKQAVGYVCPYLPPSNTCSTGPAPHKSRSPWAPRCALGRSQREELQALITPTAGSGHGLDSGQGLESGAQARQKHLEPLLASFAKHLPLGLLALLFGRVLPNPA